MYDADDAVRARESLERQALEPYVSGLTRPLRFSQKTAIVVLVEFMAGTDLQEDLIITMDCEFWVDRNIILRDKGFDTSKIETATAYWPPDGGEFVVTGTKSSLCRALREILGLTS